MDRKEAQLIRFNSKHYPAFIYVLDKEVFWGSFPIDHDAHVYDYLIQRDDISNEIGAFWERQFDLAWNQGLSYEEERNYNGKFK